MNPFEILALVAGWGLVVLVALIFLALFAVIVTSAVAAIRKTIQQRSPSGGPR